MHKHWREFGPPVYIAVAAYLGIAKAPEPPRDEDDPDGLGELMDVWGAGVI
jgi:hypothetical protein